MVTSCYCRYELFLFGFHDAAAKIIVCCCTGCCCPGPVWLGCCLKMANSLSVAFPSHTHTQTVVTTWFPWNVELLGGSLSWCSSCFSITVFQLGKMRYIMEPHYMCVYSKPLCKQLGHKKTVKVCMHVVASHPSSPHCRQLFNSL